MYFIFEFIFYIYDIFVSHNLIYQLQINNDVWTLFIFKYPINIYYFYLFLLHYFIHHIFFFYFFYFNSGQILYKIYIQVRHGTQAREWGVVLRSLSLNLTLPASYFLSHPRSLALPQKLAETPFYIKKYQKL